MRMDAELSPAATILEADHWLRLVSLCVSAGVMKAVSQVASMAGLEGLEQKLQV